jgi:glycerol-3-phosphate cytidylyltransferase
MNKLRTLPELAEECGAWRGQGKRIVWTNGCFDLFHAGHARAFAEAKAQGDILVVGINSDRSVRELKGEGRPLCSEADRAAVLSALESIDRIVVFDSKRCDAELRALKPDVWTKSGDYTEDSLDPDERAAVRGSGGRIVITPLIPGISTTLLVKKIRRLDPEKIISAACAYIRDPQGRLLLTATRYDDGVKWGLPGGGHERGESLETTARREVKEETGLDVRVSRHMGVIERIDRGMGIHLVMHMFEAVPAVFTEDFSGRAEAAIEDVRWLDREGIAACPGVVMGRRLWVEYPYADWPPYILMREGEE